MTGCRTRPAPGGRDLPERRLVVRHPHHAHHLVGEAEPDLVDARHVDDRAALRRRLENAAICGQIGAGIPLFATFAIGRAPAAAPRTTRTPRVLRLSTESRTATAAVRRESFAPTPHRRPCASSSSASRCSAPRSRSPPAARTGRPARSTARCPATRSSSRTRPGIVDRLDGWGPVQQLEVGPGRHRERLLPPDLLRGHGDPLYTVHCLRWTSSCEVEGHRVRIPSAARPAGGGDGHMAVIQPDGWEYDFWQVRDKPAGGGTLVVSHGGRTMIDGDGLGSDATAAEFGLAAGRDRGRPDEGRARSTTRCSSTPAAPPGAASTPRRPAPPGRVLADTDRTPRRSARACGSALSDGQIDALPVPPWKKTILRALHQYGGYIGDTTGGQRLLGHPGGLRLDLHELRAGRSVGDLRPAGRGSSAGTASTTSTWTAGWTGPVTCEVVDPCVAHGPC